jgi:hypothetical protein
LQVQRTKILNTDSAGSSIIRMKNAIASYNANHLHNMRNVSKPG